jgi:glycosyltransferase involved in cell wall biosynthesis
MMRVLLLNNVPAPYFDPLFAKLGEVADWDLTVCYAMGASQQVGWGEKTIAESATHRTIILDEMKLGLKRRAGSSWAAAVALLEVLWCERPDYLLCYGYTLKPQFIALIWGLLTRTPFALAGDANFYQRGATGIKRVLKGWWLRLVVRRAAALICVGTANRMFWEAYGARAEQLFAAGFAVDNDFFARAGVERPAEVEQLRARLGLTGKVVFLYVGRLIERKNIDVLIRAVRRLTDEQIALVIAGTGEEQAKLEALAQGDGRVIFAGRVAPNELPLYYALGDALVLPAREEPWGLVVNEAMACGLAVIAHRHCGAAVDLVGCDNGVALDTFEVDELAAAIELITRDAKQRYEMQQRSRAKIEPWTIATAARGIIRAISESSRPRPARAVAPIEERLR